MCFTSFVMDADPVEAVELVEQSWHNKEYRTKRLAVILALIDDEDDATPQIDEGYSSQ